MIQTGGPAKKMLLSCDFSGCQETLEAEECFKDESPSPEEVCEALSDMAWSEEWVGGDPADFTEDLAQPVENRRRTYCGTHATRGIACDATGDYGSCPECGVSCHYRIFSIR